LLAKATLVSSDKVCVPYTQKTSSITPFLLWLIKYPTSTVLGDSDNNEIDSDTLYFSISSWSYAWGLKSLSNFT
jgi:hypothetical protein